MQIDPELLAQKKKLQLEIMLKDSDAKKNEREIVQTEIVISEIKKRQAQLQAEFAVKESFLRKLIGQRSQLQNELIKMKHQINNLGR